MQLCNDTSVVIYICVNNKKIVKDTAKQYDSETAKARDVFYKKTKDYGTAWRILRPSSLTDQLFIKASRIRSIEEKGSQLVNESIELEFVALINYSVMALIQLENSYSMGDTDIALDELMKLYDIHIESTKSLMLAKNHDYGEAWRDMRVSSMTDLILMKLLRIKQIEENDGKTLISEGLDANYQDILNYAVFALIKITEEKK